MTTPSNDSIGPPAWRIVAALAFVAVMVVALVAVGGRNAESSGVAGSSTSTPAPVDDVLVTEDAEAVATTTRPPAEEPPSTTVGAGDDVPPRGAPVEGAVDDLAAALQAWGVFAATGDISAVGGFFAPSGPQYAQLVSEVEDRLANAPGLPAFSFAMESPAEVARGDASVVYRGEVRIERFGVEPEAFLWDVEMRWDPEASRWLLWTVSSAVP